MSNRIYLTGRLVRPPEVRTTPAGTPLMRLTVDSGESEGDLRLVATLAGAKVPTLAARLNAGDEIEVRGSLRSVNRRDRAGIARSEIEVVANDIWRSGESAASEPDDHITESNARTR